MTIQTLTPNHSSADEPFPMNSREEWFYREAKLLYEDDLDARPWAFARAGAENLAFQAGLIFEWETRWEDGFEVERLTARLGEEVLFSEAWFWDLSDDQCRLAESEVILDHLADRLLVEVG